MLKPYNEILKELREDNDYLQKEIANIIGISQQYYSEYEKGNRKLPIEHLIKLCNFYKISADYILGISYDYKRPLR